jgi:hypothetical protein
MFGYSPFLLQEYLGSLVNLLAGMLDLMLSTNILASYLFFSTSYQSP